MIVMLRYMSRKLFVSHKKVKKQRKARKVVNNRNRTSKERRNKLSSDLRSQVLSVDDLSGSDMPRDIEVANWILDVHQNLAHKSRSMSPTRSPTYSYNSPLFHPPTPVRSSSRMAFQRYNSLGHNYSLATSPLTYSTGLVQRNYVKKRMNRSGDNRMSPLSTNEKSKKTTKSKTKKSELKNKNISKTKTKSKDKNGSKSKRSHSRDRSLSKKYKGGERVGWEFQNVTLTRVPGYGFGIAVSGGRDNPHFINGDPAIAISDVLKAGPAEGKLQINDRVMSANGVSLENVDYTTAVNVLRECGNTVNLLIKRRTLLPNSDLVKVTLTKSNKKDDFGIVLGCKFFIKEITNRSLIDKDSSIKEGDVIIKINTSSTENLSLKEAKKLIENSKEKLNLVISREPNVSNNRQSDSNINGYPNGQSRWSTANLYDNAMAIKDTYDNINNANRSSNWGTHNQNVYVQPPTRGDYGHNSDDKNNLLSIDRSIGGPSGRNRGPISDISLQQLDQPSTPLMTSHSRNASLPNDTEAPPRPPLPRPNHYDDDPLTRRKQQTVISDPRFISFHKEGSVGIRLTGGNEVGIFVTAVQPGSPASLQGLQSGDKMLKANNKDMRGVTREDAVLFLLSLQEQIDLVVQNRKEEYDEIVANQKGDSFYIRVHFNYDSEGKGELSFHVGEVFHVVDTLFNGVVGSWLVFRLGRNNQEIQKGSVPNRNRAEELSAEQCTEKSKKTDTNTSERRGSFFKRRSARRSKSLSKDHWEDVVFGDNMSKFSAYERVTLKHPGFIRPVVLFGPLADVAREKLMKDYPDKYAFPQLDNQLEDVPKASKLNGIVKLSAIRDIVDKGKHALLDITPSAVDRLNYAQFYPIVIFMRAENKSVIKEMRSRLSKSVHKSSRKLYEQAVKLEKLWSHIFTASVTLTSADMWYKKLRETVDKQQQQSIWVSESKPEEPIGDDFLFPMISRLSYASSPESDLDLANELRLDEEEENAHRLVKASSDPSIATADENPVAMNSFGYPPPYSLRPPNKQLPLHILLRKELSKALTIEAKSKTSGAQNAISSHNSTAITNTEKEYFGSPKDSSSAYNTLKAGERYPAAPVPPNDNIYGTKTGPEPPPRIDRNNKPSRFRSAHERLFGRRDRESYTASDYINTSSAMPSSQKCDSLERTTITNGKQHINGAFGDSSSYSSDSYNKYGSPTGTLDNKQNYNTTSSNGRPAHDPYRFTRSTAQPHPSTSMKPQSPERSIKPMSPPNKYQIDAIQSRPVPPSPPPKPTNKSRLPSDGRPVPPPKPSHYPSRSWANSTDNDMTELNQMSTNGLQNNGFGYSPVYQQTKRTTQPNPDLSNGPPAYYSTMPSKDYQTANMRPQPQPLNGVNGEINNNIYAEQSSFGSPIRKGPYSDTDSSSGYMTAKSNYDKRPVYNSFAKINSSPIKDNYATNGPYLNVPYPPKHSRTSTFTTQPPPPPIPTQSSHVIQPPPSILDLQQNREHRGSAFELYRKPIETTPMRSTNLQSFGHHGLPPPPPPLVNSDHNDKSITSSVDSSHHTIIATAKGLFTNDGGILTSDETGVSVIIPPGAIPKGRQQEIYFKVCKDDKMVPPLDSEKGETLMSPIVMCGPHGLKFDVPVELRLPHCASVNPDGWAFALKSSDTNNGEPSEWQNVLLDTNDGISGPKLDNKFVSVLVDHF
ncbi:tight junction protein ZO-1-like isoform X2 [Oppia nitens]|uniref:tight junction protein ZO-1-like isoform X2 n=1 Tax=Oppia nitens TaxID=1686743 RepID=UPI0023D9FE0A|nr:tight junction protein ZO-1-like isoform X2 [Oppia nitens]